jgi:drug/metabolite transporter (DMT)-like permease
MLPFWRGLPPTKPRPGDRRRLLVLAILYPCLYYGAENLAIGQTTASQAGAVSAIAPLLVAVGARIFLAERLSRQAVAGLLLSIGGVVVLSVGVESSSGAPNPALGNAVEVAAIAIAATSTIVLKSLTGRWNPWVLIGLQLAFAAVVYLPAIALTPAATWANAPASAWAGLLYLGIVLTLPPSGLYNLAVSRMPAARAAMAINLIPVVAIVSGSLVQGDTLTAVQWVACGVILGGVLLGQRGPRPAPEAAAAPVPATPGIESA